MDLMIEANMHYPGRCANNNGRLRSLLLRISTIDYSDTSRNRIYEETFAAATCSDAENRDHCSLSKK
jgi:hypothetical protein